MKRKSFQIAGILLLLFLIVPGFVKAQVTLNCESGNRAIEQGNCWGFGATTYSNSQNMVISGSWSTRSNSLTSTNPGSCWIKTPWIMVGNGNITFQARLDGNGNGVTSKSIIVAYIPYSQGASYGEGTPVAFFTYNFPSFNTTTIRDITVPIPAEIQNSTSVYKFRVSFVGQGGNERAYSDNYIFPGTYWSDPSNNCNPMSVIQDMDGDGVADDQDNYPNDAYRAYNNYYPSAIAFGTLAFEDSWPNRADYDMNDLVLGYRFNTVTNGQNMVVEIHGDIITKASGASYKNAFGFQLDGISPSKITSVSGNSISPSSIFNLNNNGLEASQTYANCIVFDNFYTVMQHPGIGTGINTNTASPFVSYDTVSIDMIFINNGVTPPGGTVSISQLSSNAFNFYIVVNQNRGHEVHMADKAPTNLVNSGLFGTGSDDSNPATGRYYKTHNNLPWGINIPRDFEYPTEKTPINDAYLHFMDWAGSAGVNYQDWFMNLPGYRNNSNIY